MEQLLNKKLLINIPGKLVLSGEYAMLHGYHGSAIAVDQFINFVIEYDPLLSGDVHIASDDYGAHIIKLNELESCPANFLLFAKLCHLLNIANLKITIKRDAIFSGGLGFSGSCIIAMCILQSFVNTATINLHDAKEKERLLKQVIHLLKQLDHNASGIDIATQIYGGFLEYDPSNISVNCLNKSLLDEYSLVAIHCGYKKSTTECLKEIRRLHSIEESSTIIDKIGSTSISVIKAAKFQDKDLFIECVKQSQSAMEWLGVCDSNMTSIINKLYSYGAYAAKISGSGLGDCIIGFLPKSLDLSFLINDDTLCNYKACRLVINHTGVVLDYV